MPLEISMNICCPYNVDKSKSIVTNFRGEADIIEFSDTEFIYFKHLSHILKKITKQEILFRHL